MAQKYHIKPDGTIGICRAERGRCPYQSAPHFESEQDAQNYVNKQSEKEHGLLPEIKSKNKQYDTLREALKHSTYEPPPLTKADLDNLYSIYEDCLKEKEDVLEEYSVNDLSEYDEFEVGDNIHFNVKTRSVEPEIRISGVLYETLGRKVAVHVPVSYSKDKYWQVTDIQTGIALANPSSADMMEDALKEATEKIEEKGGQEWWEEETKGYLEYLKAEEDREDIKTKLQNARHRYSRSQDFVLKKREKSSIETLERLLSKLNGVYNEDNTGELMLL